MKQYLDLLRKIFEEGEPKSDRTGAGTLSLFGESMRIALRKGFPLLTTKKVFFKGMVAELLWILSGNTNANDLPEYVRGWWTPWADPKGNLGPVYGAQLRDCIGGDPDFNCDQLAMTINGLRSDPDSRRHVISLWHTPDVAFQKLPCCHGTVIQFYVTGDGHLNCFTHQRSADVFIGLPVNLASYSLLTSLIAFELGLRAGELIYSLGDSHLYANHVAQAELQLSREPRELPTVGIRFKPGAILWKHGDPEDKPRYAVEDFFLLNYDPEPAIKAPVSV